MISKSLIIFIFVLTQFCGMAIADTYVTEQMRSIQTKVSKVNSDLTKSIDLLKKLTLTNSSNIDGEKMIDQTIKSIRDLEIQIGEQSPLSSAIDNALTEIDKRLKEIAQVMSDADPELRQEIMGIKRRYEEERDKIYSQKGVVASFQRKLKAHVEKLERRKMVISLLMGIEQVTEARKSIELVVNGLQDLSHEFDKLSQDTKPAKPE